MGLGSGEVAVFGCHFYPKLAEYDKKVPDRVDSGKIFLFRFLLLYLPVDSAATPRLLLLLLIMLVIEQTSPSLLLAEFQRRKSIARILLLRA